MDLRYSMVDQPGDSVNRAPFEVEQSETDGAVVLAVSGEVDMLSAPQLAEAIHTALAPKPAASVVVATPATMLPSTIAMRNIGGTSDVRIIHPICDHEYVRSSAGKGGPSSGLMPQRTAI